MRMDRKLKIALVGLGYIGMSHLEAIKRLQCVELCAVVDANPVVGSKVAEEHGVRYFESLEGLLRDGTCEAVDLCVPTWLHEEMIVKAAACGKHILCEKPITFTLESFDRIAAAVEATNVRFMVAQVLRFWPEYAYIRDLYDAGALGQVRQVSMCRLSQPPAWAAWYQDPGKSGGALYDLMLHDLDYIQAMLGEAVCVYAAGKQSATGCWNQIHTNIQFKNGAFVSLETNNEAFGGFPFEMGMRLFASERILDFELRAGQNLETIGTRTLRSYTRGEGFTLPKVNEEDGYAAEIQYFAACVLDGVPPDKVSVGSSRKTLELLLAVKASLETGNLQWLQKEGMQ